MAGIEYLVERGEDDSALSDKCFSTREAAPILACTVISANWHEFVVAAKGDKKRLFGREGFVVSTDPFRKAYEQLFPDLLTGRQLWRTVQVGRIVQSWIRDRAASEPDPKILPEDVLPAREILRHAAWLLLHILFRRPQLQNGPTLELTEDELNKLSMEMDIVAQKLVEVPQAI